MTTGQEGEVISIREGETTRTTVYNPIKMNLYTKEGNGQKVKTEKNVEKINQIKSSKMKKKKKTKYKNKNKNKKKMKMKET